MPSRPPGISSLTIRHSGAGRPTEHGLNGKATGVTGFDYRNADRNQRRLPPPTVNFKGIVGKEPYPVARKAGDVLRTLVLRGIQRLKNLFKGNRSRSEVVATFLAILELCKTNSVSLEDDISGENPNVRLLQEPESVSEEMT